MKNLKDDDFSPIVPLTSEPLIPGLTVQPIIDRKAFNRWSKRKEKDYLNDRVYQDSLRGIRHPVL